MRLRSERKVKTQDLKSRHRCLVANVPSHLVLTNVLSEHHAASSVRILSIAVFTSPRIYIFAQRISTKIADYFFLTDFVQFNFCLWNRGHMDQGRGILSRIWSIVKFKQMEANIVLNVLSVQY